MTQVGFTIEDVREAVRTEIDLLRAETRSFAGAFDDFQAVVVENVQELTEELHEQLIQVRAEMRGLRDFIE